MTLLGATLVGHGVTIGDPRLQPASLDHSIWFHRPFRADEWWLYDQWSPSAQGARGLALARVFTQDGTLVATVAQEGLIRMRDPRSADAQPPIRFVEVLRLTSVSDWRVWRAFVTESRRMRPPFSTTTL